MRKDKLKARAKAAKKAGLTYERLFDLATAMHLEIYKLAKDEKKVYDEIGLTDKENALFGYGFVNQEIEVPDDVKQHLLDLISKIKERNGEE